MIKLTILAALITLMADPTLINAAQAAPKFVSIAATVAYAYTIDVTTKPGYVGEEGIAKIAVKPSGDFKWNKKFPAHLEIQTPEFTIATPIKEKLNHDDLTINGSDAVVCIPFKGETEGRVQIETHLSFSVCSSKECLIFRNQKVMLTFIVIKK